jgi:hypothetical protein
MQGVLEGSSHRPAIAAIINNTASMSGWSHRTAIWSISL